MVSHSIVFFGTWSWCTQYSSVKRLVRDAMMEEIKITIDERVCNGTSKRVQTTGPLNRTNFEELLRNNVNVRNQKLKFKNKLAKNVLWCNVSVGPMSKIITLG